VAVETVSQFDLMSLIFMVLCRFRSCLDAFGIRSGWRVVRHSSVETERSDSDPGLDFSDWRGFNFAASISSIRVMVEMIAKSNAIHGRFRVNSALMNLKISRNHAQPIFEHHKSISPKRGKDRRETGKSTEIPIITDVRNRKEQ